MFPGFAGFRGDAVSKAANSEGGWEPHIQNIIRSVVREGETVIDVGANIGVHTVALAKAVGPSGRVIAIEPQAAVLTCLRKNLKAHECEAQVQVFEGLAGDVAAPTGGKMHEPNPRNVGTAYVDLDGVGDLPTATLDDLAGPDAEVTFIKADVQGFETRVFRGASGILTRKEGRRRPVLVVEIEEAFLKFAKTSSDELMTLLLQHGYVLFRIRRRKFFADHLCVPKEYEHDRDWASLTQWACDVVRPEQVEAGLSVVQCVFGPAVKHSYVTCSIVPKSSASSA